MDFLSFSLPDAIMSSLAGIQSLVVRSTLAGSRYSSDEGVDLKKIAAEAGVDAVLCGTLLQAGGQIRVTAQLLEASSGTILWSKTIQVELKDIFDVQDELAKAIVESLSIPLSSGDQRRLRKDLPASARAYEFYLRANQLAHDSAMMPVAAELYQSALAEDPDYAPAWARLGRVYRVMAKYGTENVNAKSATGRARVSPIARDQPRPEHRAQPLHELRGRVARPGERSDGAAARSRAVAGRRPRALRRPRARVPLLRSARCLDSPQTVRPSGSIRTFARA